MDRGVLFALLTAMVSGVSIFVNSFGVKFGDPFVYTTIKNSLVVLFLFSLILLLGKRKELFSLTKRQIGQLVLIGFIGGSVPFLLFFYGLSLGLASVSSFIFRSLFIFATLFAILFLKEKMDKRFILGAAIIFIGNLFLVKGDIGFGLGQILVLLATVFWAVEYNYSRKVLQEISPKIVAFGRMFFGSFFLLIFLGFNGQFSTFLELNMDVWIWGTVASLFLLLYVVFWYNSLKFTTISKATSILVLGGPITYLLNLIFLNSTLNPVEALGMLFSVIGVILILGTSTMLKSLSELKTIRRVFE